MPGSVLISPSYGLHGHGCNIVLDGIIRICGSLIADDFKIWSCTLSSITLTTIDHQFKLRKLSLNDLSFPELTSVGSLNWSYLWCNKMEFNKNQIQVLDFVNIDHAILFPIQLSLTMVNKLATVSLVNNSLPLTVFFYFQDSEPSIYLENNLLTSCHFTGLYTASNITVRNSPIDLGILWLANVEGSIVIDGTSLRSIEFPLLTTINGDLIITNNQIMYEPDSTIPLLTSIGGRLQMLNNRGLNSLYFPSLSTIGQALINDAPGHTFSTTQPNASHVEGEFSK